MRYSLFVDESGDFQRSKEWIVSGLLCPYDKTTAENNLKKTLGHLLQRSGISSIKKMHLTELRQERGHTAAVEIAESLFSSLCNSQYKWKLVVARNKTKFSLSDPERTYRLMLLDLIALAESTIPEQVKLSGFDIIIATRTDKNGERMTTLGDLDQEVVKRISNALEAGIASRGLIDFVDSKGLEIVTLQANKSWGLIIADFISNISYNYWSAKESMIIEKFKKTGLLSEFQSFGEYQERRARVAQRDGNFIDAIRRWAYIDYKTDEEKKQQAKILTQLFDHIITLGTAGPRSTLDAIIEHIWRDEELKGKYGAIYLILQRLEVALIQSYKKNQSPLFVPLLFRVQNFMHFVANKIGNTSQARKLIDLKKQLESQIALSPEFFPLILDSQLYEIDTAENALLLSDCLTLAKSHYSLVQQYKECWELLLNDNAAYGFNSSRISIKAEMTLLRSQILVGDTEEVRAALSRIYRLRDIIINNEDKRRLLNYEVLAFFKIEDYEKSLIIGINEFNLTQDIFTLQNILRSAVSGLLYDEKKFNKFGVQLYSLMKKYIMKKNGHPVDLIWRDWGMLDFLITSKKTVALKNLKRSKNHLLLMDQNAYITKWLHVLLDIHIDFINERLILGKYIDKLDEYILHTQVRSLVCSYNTHKNSKELLSLFRHVSPC